jgi:23S rRNA pseudouridine1911/1915/1917 synthase
LVINKPSGLPVMPGGGFLLHTLTALLEPTGARPVHRLGRFTSGLQMCARTQQTRALWSKQFRPDGGCRKVYQAWSQRVPGLELGQCLRVSSDVVERPHPLLGWIWGPEPLDDAPIRKRLSAHSQLQLLERTAEGDRLQVTITTGRPHQIRIHLAQLGSPLLGDPLYLRNREIAATATPGDGGYRLHAWRLSGLPHLGETTLQVDPPSEGDQALRNSISREK